MKLVMHPVRQRIIEFLAVHGSGSTAQISEAMSDVPPATLYRHMRLLAERGLISVTEERKVRGTTEKIYALVRPDGQTLGNEEAAAMVESVLLNLLEEFRVYFAQPDADPVRDMLSAASSTFLMTDAEYMEFLGGIGNLIGKAVNLTPAPGRKARRLVLFSQPLTLHPSENQTEGEKDI